MRKLKAMIKFDKDEQYLVIHLAKKYANGSVSQFVHDLVMNVIKTEFKDEIAEDIKIGQTKSTSRS